jgi:molecular chaperone GrpE
MHKHKDKKAKGECCSEQCSCSDTEHTPADEYSPEDYEALVAERDDLRTKYQRALADYQNAQRRFTADMTAAREAGVERVLGSLIPVLDHFDLAMSQSTGRVSAEQVLAGVTMIRDEFNRAMGAFGVTPISPAIGDEFDPAQHAALSQLAAAGVGPGRVSGVYQIGYRVGERVVRPAKVTLAPPAEQDQDAPAESQGDA